MMCPYRIYMQRKEEACLDKGRLKHCSLREGHDGECFYDPEVPWIELDVFPFAVLRHSDGDP